MPDIAEMGLPAIKKEIERRGYVLTLEHLEQYRTMKKGSKPFWIWHAVIWTPEMKCMYWVDRKTELDAARSALRRVIEQEGK